MKKTNQPRFLCKKKFYLALGSFTLGLVLSVLIFYPVFGDKNGYEILTEMINGNQQELDILGDEPPGTPEPYFYEHFIPPEDSFGIGETTFKTMNWSYFWQLFREHSAWQLEAWHPIQEVWVDEWQGTNLNEWLNISRIRSSDNGSEKITLNVTNNHPTQPLRFRFKFGIDLRVKNYVNKTSNYEYWLNYTVPNTEETYHVFFNWSDLQPLVQSGKIHTRKGIRNVGGKDVFYFMIIANQTLASGKSFEVDPTFGYEGASGAGGFDIKNYMSGTPYTASSSGSVDNISAFIRNDATNKDIMFVMYKWSDKSFIGKTSEGTAIANTDQWYTLNIDGTCDVVVSTEYILAAWSEDSTGDCTIGYDEETDYHVRWDSENYDASPPSTFSDDDNYTDHRATIYASYTAVNNAPTQSGEAPTNQSINVSAPPDLYVVCVDNDSTDTMNATWWSNSSGSWVQFASNNSISNNTNITQTFDNVSANAGFYWWSVNLTDGNGSWCNDTYKLESSPYGTAWFNDTFDDTNYQGKIENMTHAYGLQRTLRQQLKDSIVAVSPTHIELTDNGEWTEYDLSSYIPPTAIGVIFEVTIASTSEYNFGIRHPDSTLDVKDVTEDRAHQWFCVGTDGTSVDMYQNNLQITPYLVGYINAGMGEFLVDAWDYSTSTLGSYVDVDTTSNWSQTPSIVFGFFETGGASGDRMYAIRENGSTDDLYKDAYAGDIIGFMVSCDDNGIFEQKIEDATTDMYVTGCLYQNASVVTFTDAKDESTETAGSWVDTDLSMNVTEEPVGVFVHAYGTIDDNERSMMLRSGKYQTYEFTQGQGADISEHRTGWVESNESAVIQQKIENADIDLYIFGYTKNHTNTTESYYISTIISQTGDGWDKFYAGVNDTTNCSFAIIDSSDDTHNISSGLTGDGDDISGVSNDSIRVYANFSNNNVTWNYLNLTWTAESNKSWQVIDESINGEFTNATLWTVIDDTINGEFTNTTTWQVVDDTINGVFTNATVWTVVDDTINGEFTNTTAWRVIDESINGEFTNTTVWRILDESINGVFTNITQWIVVDDTINGEFTNTTLWRIIDESINGVFTNTTVWQTIDNTINGSFTNTSVRTWQTIDDTINGVFTNTTTWKTIDSTINGEFTNTTTWRIIDDTINGAFTNTTAWKTIDDTINGVFTNTTTWYILDSTINGVFANITTWIIIDDTINGEFTNVTPWNILDDTINGSFTNTSIPANITITNPYPSNESTQNPTQPTVYVTVAHTNGEEMNVSYYYGLTQGSENTLILTNQNVTNGTDTALFYAATNRTTTYYWRVMAHDGTNYINETFSFTTEGANPGSGRSANLGMAILGILFGTFGIISMFLFNKKRKRKRRKRKEYMEEYERWRYR